MSGGTERFSRALTYWLPRDLRDECGDDIVQLACDRRRYRQEPLWRLWPSLVGDTASSAVRFRLEEAMFPTRAVLGGLGLAFAAFAFLSGGLLIGLLALVVVGVVLLRTEPARPSGRRAPRWMPWAATGLVLSVASFAVVGFAEDEFSALEWTSVLGLLVLGLWALGTSAVIAVDARRVQSI